MPLTARRGFVATAKRVRRGGSWVVLGVGPGKTTRLVETESPVDSILAERGAKHINVNILRYFSEPAILDGEAKAFLRRGMTLAMEWAVQGLVLPHVGRTIDSTVEAINAGLQSLKLGRNTLGKVAVLVDRGLEGELTRGRLRPLDRRHFRCGGSPIHRPLLHHILQRTGPHLGRQRVRSGSILIADLHVFTNVLAQLRISARMTRNPDTTVAVGTNECGKLPRDLNEVRLFRDQRGSRRFKVYLWKCQLSKVTC